MRWYGLPYSYWLRNELVSYAGRKNLGARSYPETRTRVVQLWMGYRVAVQMSCFIIMGHESSDAERTFAGGNIVDHWCRWCGKHYLTIIEKGK